MELTLRRGCVIPCELHVVGHKQYCFQNAFLFELVDTKISILLDTWAFCWLGPQAHKQTQSTDLARERERLQRWRKSWPAHRLPSGILPHTKQSGILPHTVCVTYYHTPTKPIARCTLNTKNCTLQPFHCAYYCTSHISFCTKYTSYNTHRVIFTSNSNTACCRLQPAH